MPSFIIKVKDEKFNKDYYMEWSTIVDAPVTYGMSLDEFKEYYKEQYGIKGMEGLEDRMTRVEEKGTSSRIDDSLEELMIGNRAGKKETELDLEGILHEYCRNHMHDAES